MGADYIAIIGCPLQQQLGEEDFARGIKLLAHVHSLEAMRDRIEAEIGRPLEQLSISIGGTNNPGQQITFAEMQKIATPVETGIPECATCPVSDTDPVGCYRFVSYPVDTVFEELLFEYFIEMLEHPHQEYQIAKDASGRTHTAAALIHDLVIPTLPAQTPWHVQRGPAEAGGLAERSQPISRSLTSTPGAQLDSAHVLQATFLPIDDALTLQLYAHLFRGFERYVADKPVAARSQTVSEVKALATLLVGATQALEHGPVNILVMA